MKNKLLLIVLIVVAGILLTACDGETLGSGQETSYERFEVYKATNEPMSDDFIIVHKETGCCYLFFKHGKGAGLCALLDAEGKPLLWEGE